jgi:hypothetical protein
MIAASSTFPVIKHRLRRCRTDHPCRSATSPTRESHRRNRRLAAHVITEVARMRPEAQGLTPGGDRLYDPAWRVRSAPPRMCCFGSRRPRGHVLDAGGHREVVGSSPLTERCGLLPIRRGTCAAVRRPRRGRAPGPSSRAQVWSEDVPKLRRVGLAQTRIRDLTAG